MCVVHVSCISTLIAFTAAMFTGRHTCFQAVNVGLSETRWLRGSHNSLLTAIWRMESCHVVTSFVQKLGRILVSADLNQPLGCYNEKLTFHFVSTGAFII